jgi:virginiamycin B lyase
MIRLCMVFATALVSSIAGGTVHAKMVMHTFPVLAGAGAHDVYPAPDGGVWFTAQSAGKLGHLDPRTGRSDLIALGPGAAPHGVIVGPDGAAWVTEDGQNAIARVDPATHAVKLFALPKERPPTCRHCKGIRFALAHAARHVSEIDHLGEAHAPAQ